MGDRDSHCVVCEHSLRRRRRHVLHEGLLETRRDLVVHLLRAIEPPQEVSFDGSRAICHACWHSIDSEATQDRAGPQPAPAVVAVANVVNPPGMTRAANTSRRCMFHNCNRTELRHVPNSIKVHLLNYFNFYIPIRARICHQHLLHTTVEDIPGNVRNHQSGFNGESINDIVNIYRTAMEHRTFLDFENIQEISEYDFHFWTGLNREKFMTFLNQVPTLHQQSDTPRRDLALYLSKLRTGEPNDRLATVFNISRRTVDRKIHSVRRCLLEDFVPVHLGLDHITRDQVIERNRLLPNYFFGNDATPKAIIILDGTYLFIEKSTNFLFQRVTYSTHKYRNLIKPFMIVCADGYILDVTGPYSARTSDANIMKQILNNHNEPIEEAAFHYFFEEGDVFILDRGFRDAVPTLESHGYVPHMPPSKRRNETQLSTENANKSRLITLVRWVVETMNGRFKRDFKLFRNRIFNLHVPHILKDFKIAAAIINAFQEPYTDSPYTNAFIEIINANMNRPNLLAEYVENNNLNRQRAIFTRLVADSPEVADFPRLTIEEIILFSVGTYHVKIARSYCSEHLKRTGVYEMELYRHPDINDNDILLRCRIHSRHTTSKTYYTYILFNAMSEGRDAITGYYCSCIQGRRTLGSCAHVISIIYYLGWARHHEEFDHPALGMDDVLIIEE